MLLLQDITDTLPHSEPLIRVYNSGKIVINSVAMKMLRLDDSSRVAFTVNRIGDRKRVYIGKRSDAPYSVNVFGNRCRICSTPLSRAVAGYLNGYGTYRIERDFPETGYDGATYYPIFFKKYN